MPHAAFRQAGEARHARPQKSGSRYSSQGVDAVSNNVEFIRRNRCGEHSLLRIGERIHGRSRFRSRSIYIDSSLLVALTFSLLIDLLHRSCLSFASGQVVRNRSLPQTSLFLNDGPLIDALVLVAAAATQEGEISSDLSTSLAVAVNVRFNPWHSNTWC